MARLGAPDPKQKVSSALEAGRRPPKPTSHESRVANILTRRHDGAVLHEHPQMARLSPPSIFFGPGDTQRLKSNRGAPYDLVVHLP